MQFTPFAADLAGLIRQTGDEHCYTYTYIYIYTMADQQLEVVFSYMQLEYGFTRSRGKIGDHMQLEYKDTTNRVL